MSLRPYQLTAIDAIRGDFASGLHDLLLVMATGAGKTQTFLAWLMGELDADPTARALVVAHRQELIYQPLERIGQMDHAWLERGPNPLMPRVGLVMADHDAVERQLTVATIQTLASDRRLQRLLAHGPITHLVVDECHHATAPTYLKVWDALRTASGGTLKHLGVTATPLRSDGDGLGKVYQKDSAKVTIADLVRLGYLVQPRWLGIATGISLAGVQSREGDFVQSQLAQCFDTEHGRAIVTQAYQQYAAGRHAIAFTASVAGAHDLADAFRRLGVSAAAIDGTTPKDVRQRTLAAFRRGEIHVLCNCQVLTEGFDAPIASCVLMARPTRSDSNYVQCIGRGLRPRHGKAEAGEDCLILDFLPQDARNIVMAGDVLGLPKEVTRKAITEATEPGAVQGGFTFDGERFNTEGTPLEIIARQLDYLQASPFRWHERDGWLTLGLGAASDGHERLLAVPPPERGLFTLYGIARRVEDVVGERNKRYGRWQAQAVCQTRDLAELGERANSIAETWGSQTLTAKGRSWHGQPASDGQKQYLRRVCQGALTSNQIMTLSKGEVAGLIDHYQARQVLAAWGTAALAAAPQEVTA